MKLPRLVLPAMRIVLVSACVMLSSVRADERRDRHVDRAALDSQLQAAAKLRPLLKRYRKTDREPALLLKLAEIQSQAAAIEFRIAYGAAHAQGKDQAAANLKRYRGLLQESVATLSEYIARFQREPALDQAYFMRATAHHELEKLRLAKADFTTLTSRFPHSRWFFRATMALADYAIEANQHEQAIAHLDQIVAHPEEPLYPFALYKEAWSHFNLKHLPMALTYLERNIRFYDEARKQAPEGESLSESDEAMREHSLLDVAVFYVDAMEKKLPEYSVTGGVALFRRLDSGPDMGKVAVRFAKLLRSHGRDTDLVALRDLLIQEEYARPQTLEVAAMTFEYFYNQRAFPKMEEAARQFALLDRKTEGRMRTQEDYRTAYVDAQKMLLATADRLQALSVKNKNAREVSQLTQALASIYAAFTEIVDESDPRIPRVRYNLAETLFQVRDYAQATLHYQWAVEHWTRKSGLSLQDLRLKQIAARYEVLKAEKQVAQEITPQPLRGESRWEKLQDPSAFAEWVAWVDDYADDFDLKSESERNWLFEADRALYAHGFTNAAVARLAEFIDAYPQSRFTRPAMSLILDTHVAAQDWKSTYELALRYAERTEAAEFKVKLEALAADSFYKTIELAHSDRKWDQAMRLAAQFSKKFPKHARVADALFLTGKIALESGDRALATEQIGALLERFPKSKDRAQALWIRAKIAEENYEYASAARDYREYLKAEKGDEASSKRRDLEKRILVMTWLTTQSGGAVDCAPYANAALGEELELDCDRYAALGLLRVRSTRSNLGAMAKERMKQGFKENRALWAAVLLAYSTELPYGERLSASRTLAAGWKRLDSVAQFATIPTLNEQLPGVLHEGREALKSVAPLKASQKSIARRLEWMTEMENTAAAGMKLPWARVKASLLREMGDVYADFSQALAALPPPKDLKDEERAEYQKSVAEIVEPFSAKGAKLHQQALEVASSHAVESEIVSQLVKGRAPASVRNRPIDEDLLDDAPGIDPRVGRLWREALHKKQWEQVAFYAQELRDKFQTPESTLHLLRAVALAPIGAQSEALQELESAKAGATRAQRQQINRVLYAQYVNSGSSQKAQEVSLEMQRDTGATPSPEQRRRS